MRDKTLTVLAFATLTAPVVAQVVTPTEAQPKVSTISKEDQAIVDTLMALKKRIIAVYPYNEKGGVLIPRVIREGSDEYKHIQESGIHLKEVLGDLKEKTPTAYEVLQRLEQPKGTTGTLGKILNISPAKLRQQLEAMRFKSRPVYYFGPLKNGHGTLSAVERYRTESPVNGVGRLV